MTHCLGSTTVDHPSVHGGVGSHMYRNVFLAVLLCLSIAACGGGVEDGDQVGKAETTTDTMTEQRSYYIHLRPGTDPKAFARDYNLTPLDIIEEPRPGLYVRLTLDERDRLREDSAVVNLAWEVHGGMMQDSTRAIRGFEPSKSNVDTASTSSESNDA